MERYSNSLEKAQDNATSEKTDRIENLFNELSNYSSELSQEPKEPIEFLFPEEFSNEEKNNQINENLNPQIEEIKNDVSLDNISLEGLKQLREEIAKLKDEEEKNENSQGNSLQSNKVLVKTNNQGYRSFRMSPDLDDNIPNALQKTFLNCAILGFTTLTIGGSWFAFIVSHF